MKRVVVSEIRINCDPKEILEALMDINHLKAWWGVDSCFIERKDGGLYTLTWLRSSEGIKFISTGRINLYNYRSHLYLEDVLYINSEKPILGPFTIKYDVAAHDNYSILKVTQNGFKKEGDTIWDWYYKAVADGWPQALIMLKKYLEKLD